MELKLVDCTRSYWDFVSILRMHPENQEGFFTYAYISPDDQIKYMETNWDKYKICLLDKEPVGYVGLLNGKEITYCVHPRYKGKGIGTFMLKEFIPKWHSVEALVKPENIASQKVFEKLGFEKRIYYIWTKPKK